jgi:hypothetical protein
MEAWHTFVAYAGLSVILRYAMRHWPMLRQSWWQFRQVVERDDGEFQEPIYFCRRAPYSKEWMRSHLGAFVSGGKCAGRINRIPCPE